jgi:hypothetical protein
MHFDMWHVHILFQFLIFWLPKRFSLFKFSVAFFRVFYLGGAESVSLICVYILAARARARLDNWLLKDSQRESKIFIPGRWINIARAAKPLLRSFLSRSAINIGVRIYIAAPRGIINAHMLWLRASKNNK